MNKIKIYVLLACLWAVSALQAQNFGSEAMRKLQMAEFAISHFYVDKVDEDKLCSAPNKNMNLSGRIGSLVCLFMMRLILPVCGNVKMPLLFFSLKEIPI